MVLETKLRRMGKGWFILRLAKERGYPVPTNIDYGTENAMKTRENTFENTRCCHEDMLGYLISNWCKKIIAGDPVLNNKDLFDIAKAIKK